MMEETEWLVMFVNKTGTHLARVVWAVDGTAAVLRARTTLTGDDCKPIKAVQMTAEDDEAIADMEWWKSVDDEEEAELDREREKFDTFRMG